MPTQLLIALRSSSLFSFSDRESKISLKSNLKFHFDKMSHTTTVSNATGDGSLNSSGTVDLIGEVYELYSVSSLFQGH